ncbi:hypothetical protein OSB04_016157 [Centaurea solstitialis]|uniref:non-specific serine/threonine protein kinase n=1 Tax=Centaurea solstitialis TaxID=347529 RepID=A0AA38W873_9ASTR|nr:hypothetical protein OSB04_016157 [Centaurea solstitialis]
MAILAYLLLLFTPFVASLTFNFTDFGQGNLPQDIRLAGRASFTEQGIELTPPVVLTAGRATYIKEPHLWDKASGELASFTTDFSLVVDSMSDALYADGLTFFLAENNSMMVPSGGSMGLPANDDNQGLKYPLFVAVEFDSYGGNYCDGPLVYDHVGIDINNLSSVTARKWYSNIPAGELCKTPITYDSASKKLVVSFTGFQHNYTVASQDLLEYMIDLGGMLPERVIFGFSAATGTDRFQRNNVKSWTFSSSDLRKSPDPVKGKVAIVVGRKKKTQEDKAQGHGFDFEMNNEFDLGNGPRRFSYLELAGSTGDFAENEKLEEGGFGGVYKGFLKDSGTHVAVKRVSKTSKQGIKEYSSEVRIISRLRHRNLVQLIGWCHEKRELLLVYEFMENGSLDSHLFKARSLLTWGTRYKINGLASALLYLHEEWEQCVLHRDIKSNNVMLDSNFNVKLGDFGLAKLVDHEKGSQTTLLAGTLGYMAPECALTGKASKESDVFSVRIALGSSNPELGFSFSESEFFFSDSEFVLSEFESLFRIKFPNRTFPESLSELNFRIGFRFSESNLSRITFSNQISESDFRIRFLNRKFEFIFRIKVSEYLFRIGFRIGKSFDFRVGTRF